MDKKDRGILDEMIQKATEILSESDLSPIRSKIMAIIKSDGMPFTESTLLSYIYGYRMIDTFRRNGAEITDKDLMEELKIHAILFALIGEIRTKKEALNPIKL